MYSKYVWMFIFIYICQCLVPALQKRPDEINVRASDMWSFSILLWELTTREVPFSHLSPMEVGMKVRYSLILSFTLR